MNVGAGALVVLVVAGCGHNHARRGAWMDRAKFGVMVHYLGGGPGWQETVNSFDVESFVADLARTRADYLMFSLGQNSGYYASPNATYERLCGYPIGSHCSKRDLPREIARRLTGRGMHFLLYLPSRAPQRDPQAMVALGDPGQRLPAPQEFTRRWSEVIAEWSSRYGPLVSGWWFDGAYATAGWTDYSKPYNFRTWAAAARAGNPDSVVAFNGGVSTEPAFSLPTDAMDYTAGEQRELEETPLTRPIKPPARWHVMSYLGPGWAKAAAPRHSDEAVIDYVKRVNVLKGVVTLDVSISNTGQIYPPRLQQLIAIGRAVGTN